MKNLKKIIFSAITFSIMACSASQATEWTLRSSINADLADALELAATKQDATETASIAADSGDAEKVFVVRQKLRNVIQAAATRSSYNVDISRGIRGMAENVSLPGDLIEMLDQLGQTNDIVWYRKDSSIYVSTSAENKSRLIFLGETSFKRFESSVKEAGIIAPNFRFEYLSDAQSVSVAGPVSYLANLELIAEALGKSTGSSSVVMIKAGVVDTVRR